MTFYTVYHAMCDVCDDVLDFGGVNKAAALVVARQMGWQGEATLWGWEGIELDWNFYCPTHRTDLE